MKLCYIVEDSPKLTEAILQIALRGLGYSLNLVPILYFAAELTIECDPSEAAEIEEILAPVV